MRMDLDVIRERRILREVREEMASDPRGLWGWASTFRARGAVPTRLPTEEELSTWLTARPGTPDGGY